MQKNVALRAAFSHPDMPSARRPVCANGPLTPGTRGSIVHMNITRLAGPTGSLGVIRMQSSRPPARRGPAGTEGHKHANH